MRLISKKIKNGIVHKQCSGLDGCGKYLTLDYFSSYKTIQGTVHHRTKCKKCACAYMMRFKAGDRTVRGLHRDDYKDLLYQELTTQAVINYPNIKGSNRSVITGMFGY
jgi:hypothetical protein